MATENRHAHEFAVIFGKRHQTRAIQNLDPVGTEQHKPFLAQIPQHAIEVDRRQAKRIGQLILRQRTIIGIGIIDAAGLDPVRQFQEQMRGADIGAAASDIGEMLDQHGALS